MSPAEQAPDGRKTRALERRARRRLQILAAACGVFSAKGYHATSVADILKAARIARGTFYLYFPSKRAIFDELLEQMFSQIRGALKRIKVGQGEHPVLDQMYLNVRGVVDVLLDERELTIILLRESLGLDPDLDRKINDFYERTALLIEGALDLGQSMGVVRACDARLVSFCVLGSVKEVMARLLAGPDPDSQDRQRLSREIMDYNLHGLFVTD